MLVAISRLVGTLVIQLILMAAAELSERQEFTAAAQFDRSPFPEQKSLGFDCPKTRARHQRGYAGAQRLALSIGKRREHLASELYGF
jgi:hypothetical protein